MTEHERNLSADGARQVASAVRVELPDARAEQLAEMYNNFMSGFDKVREIDASGYDPPTLTFESEAER